MKHLGIVISTYEDGQQVETREFTLDVTDKVQRDIEDIVWSATKYMVRWLLNLPTPKSEGGWGERPRK